MTNRISDIVFIDRPCGSGKTHEMLDQLKEATGQSYLIVLPTLDEADRYTDALGDQVEVPVPEDTKAEDILHLLNQGSTIVTTHALFDRMDSRHHYFLKDYVAVVDEAVEVIKPIDGPVRGFEEVYVAHGYAKIEDDGRVIALGRWKDEIDRADGVLSRTLLNLAIKGRLWKSVDSGFWSNQLPLEVFTLPIKMVVMTYLHQYSYLSLFLQHKGIAYRVKRNDEQEQAFRLFCKEYVEVTRGSSAYLESCNWSATATKKITGAKAAKIKAAMANVRKRDLGDVETEDIIWSTLKAAKEIIGGAKGKTTAHNFVSRSTKGTNKHDQASVGLYLNSIHLHPTIAGFYHASPEFKDGYALSEMLQWVFRMRCRRYGLHNNEPLEAIRTKVIAPSKRMRDLWERYLDGDI